MVRCVGVTICMQRWLAGGISANLQISARHVGGHITRYTFQSHTNITGQGNSGATVNAEFWKGASVSICRSQVDKTRANSHLYQALGRRNQAAITHVPGPIDNL